jgi:hypothetical protein
MRSTGNAMRRSLLGVLAMASVIYAQPVASSYWRVRAEVATGEVRVGRAIEVTVILKNISSMPLKLMDIAQLADYRVVLKDERGVVLQYNERTKQLIERLQNGPIFHSDTIELMPGKEARTSINLNELYDAIQPGKYFLETERIGPVQVGERITKPTGLVAAPIEIQVSS